MTAISAGHATAEFGRLLGHFRRTRGITQRDLAQQARMTPEHLSRIECGHRPPPRRAAVERLATALGMVAGSRDWMNLFDAAGYESDGNAPLALLAVAEVAALLRGSPNRVWLESDEAQLPSLADPLTALSALPRVIHGAEAIVHASIVLLRAAAASSPPADGAPICVTPGGIGDMLGVAPSLRFVWDAALRGALQARWSVRHAYRLSDDDYQSVRLVRELLGFVGQPGQFEPLLASGGFSGPDLLLVPGIGSLIFLRTGSAPDDSALLLVDADTMRGLGDHFAQSCRANAHPLITVYDQSTRGSNRYQPNLAYEEAITAAEENVGDRFGAMDGLALARMPLPVWKRRVLQQARATTEYAILGTLRDIEYLYAQAVRRHQAFAQQVDRWRFRDLCPRRAIERLVTDGVFPYDERSGDFTVLLSPQDRAEIILHLLALLYSHPNYELALLDREREDLTKVIWMVKGERVVFLAGYPLLVDGRRSRSTVVISDERVAASFSAYFGQIWNDLPSKSRDRVKVSRWLEQQLNRLC